MSKFKGKDYSELSDSTKQRLEATLIKVHKTGFTINELLEMNDNEFRQVYKTNAKNLDSQRSLLRQVKGTSERKEINVKRATLKYEGEGFSHRRLEQIKKELVKTTGHTFVSIYKEVQKEYEFKDKQEAYEYTRQLLKIPMKDIDNLNIFDKELIEGYDTSP